MVDGDGYTRDVAAMQVQKWKEQNLKVVFTNGVFDLLHVGHLKVLEAAATCGDRLVVAVNSDASVKRLKKGPNRPIHPQVHRARLLAAFRCVNAVVVFDEDTPLSLVQQFKPDVLVKGGDYEADCTDSSDPRYVVGSKDVKLWGGQVVVVPMATGQSTTATVAKIRNS